MLFRFPYCVYIITHDPGFVNRFLKIFLKFFQFWHLSQMLHILTIDFSSFCIISDPLRHFPQGFSLYCKRFRLNAHREVCDLLICRCAFRAQFTHYLKSTPAGVLLNYQFVFITLLQDTAYQPTPNMNQNTGLTHT